MEHTAVYSLFVNTQSPIIVCNLQGEILFSNESFEKVFLYSKTKISTISIFELFKTPLILPNLKPDVYEIKTANDTIKTANCFCGNIDASTWWISLLPVSLNEDQKTLRAIIDSAVDGIIIINRKGAIESMNPAAAQIFGYSKEEVIGNNVKMLMPESHSIKHDQYINNYVNTGERKIIGIGREVIGRKKDGTLFPFKLSISEVKVDERIIFTGIIHDLSDKARAEETELALQKEKELSELKSRFVSMASHEFRTPLSTIASSASLIDSYSKPEHIEKRKKHINRINKNITLLTTILDDFLSLSKLEEGLVKKHNIYFDLADLLKEILEEMQMMCKENQKIQLNFEGDTQVFLDKKLLTNILLNLLSNAIKYSPKASEIEIKVNNNQENLFITIKDQGIGIPKEEQNQLFERFFRAKNVSNIQGTGLGLNIVKKYVELMNGEISFKSEENIGTIFYLFFKKQNHHRI